MPCINSRSFPVIYFSRLYVTVYWNHLYGFSLSGSMSITLPCVKVDSISLKVIKGPWHLQNIWSFFSCYDAKQNVWTKVKKKSSKLRAELENFDTHFYVVFDRYWLSFNSGKEAGHWAISPTKFDNFLIFSNLLRSYVLTLLCLKDHIVYAESLADFLKPGVI